MPNSNEYMREYMLKRYHRRRTEAIKQLGGKCVDCGSTQNLEFDHAVASTKKYDIAKIFSGGSEVKVQAELALCVLRCNTHHKQKSVQMQDIDNVEHGGGQSGKRNCPCDPCKARKAEYMRAYRAQRMGLEA